MYMVLINKKDIISINQSIGEDGNLINEGTLEFALNAIAKKQWLYCAAYLVRCLAIYHPFQDGNKRTALGIALIYFDYYDVDYDGDKLVASIYLLAKENMTDINKIMRTIKNAIIR